jgi:hypothetical protein
MRHLRILLAIVVGASTLGCGASATTVARGALERVTAASARMDHSLAESRRERSAEIRARPDATLEEHRAAMAFYDEALEVTRDLRSSVLAAESAIDASEQGQQSDYFALFACVLSGLSELTAIATRRVEIPDDVGDVLLLVSSFVRGACPEVGR